MVFDGWMSHNDDVCWVCEQGRKCNRGGRPKKIKLDGRPPEIPIRNLVHHIGLIAPPPLVSFTEEPPKLVGNASRDSAMCPLCLEVLNNPIELVTCGAIVYAPNVAALGLKSSMSLCVPVVMGII